MPYLHLPKFIDSRPFCSCYIVRVYVREHIQGRTAIYILKENKVMWKCFIVIGYIYINMGANPRATKP
jgi:hypothetical protein